MKIYYMASRYTFLPGIILCAVCSSGVTNLSAQSGSRLSAQSFYLDLVPGIFAPVDSSKVVYPSNNTNKPVEQDGFVYSAGAYAKGGRNLFTYNSGGKDSVLYGETWNSGTSAYDKYSRTAYSYDGSGNETLSFYEVWATASMAYVNSSRIMRTYNATNKQLFSQSQVWRPTTSTWRTIQELSYTRDAADRLTRAVSRRWNGSTGNFTGADSTLYLYNAGNGIARSVRYKYNLPAAAFQPDTKDTTFFDAAGIDTLSTSYVYNLATAAWDLQSRTTRTYNSSAAGKQSVFTLESWNSATSAFTRSSRILQAENTFGQLLLYQVENRNGSNWDPTYGLNYYYEPYNELSIAGVAPKMSLQVSPNPASGYITALTQWLEPQDFSVTISDVQGKVYQRFSGARSSQSALTIPVHELADGNYILSIKGAAGTGVSRMFTVQH